MITLHESPGKSRKKPTVREYSAHVLVCKGGSCKKRGAKDTQKVLKKELRSEGLNRRVRVDVVDCLGYCKHGPNAVVHDADSIGGTWYIGLDKDSVPEVVTEHLRDGVPVRRLAAGRKR